jgi:AFG3 family protein
VKKVVDECYADCKKILEEKRELIHSLAETLLAKETIGLIDIVKILGPRPFPMKESLKEYL